MNMKGPPNAKPNLDDVLARDFAELKVGEKNIQAEAEPSNETMEDKAAPLPPVQTPVVYNQQINAIEDRASFSVRPPSAEKEEATEGVDEEEMASHVILEAPTSTIGDDFDVAW